MADDMGRLASLRCVMADEKLDGWIVPHADEFQNEMLPPAAERLAWLTGFTGSAGIAVVLSGGRAAVFTDSRYTIQVRRQTDESVYETFNVPDSSPLEWAAGVLKNGGTIGYDPRLVTIAQLEAWQKKASENDLVLRPVMDNLIDRIWEDRPAEPATPVTPFPLETAGWRAAEKLEMIRHDLAARDLFGFVLTMPDSVAWLLNVRAQDVPHTPLPLSRLIIRADRLTWFIDPARVPEDLRRALAQETGIEILPPDRLSGAVTALGEDAAEAGKSIGLDYSTATDWVRMHIESGKGRIADVKDPCAAPRARKTSAELEGMRRAHVMDALALVRFLFWLERAGKAELASLSEFDLGERLLAFRTEAGGERFRGPSFDTIAGYNENGAVVHYRAEEKTAARIVLPGVLLLDSGGQYDCGTTDITRTIPLGEPSRIAEMFPDFPECYTRVLMGHIALAMARFPDGTRGVQLDAFARRPLWDAGLDYMHGTGHGVGCHLSVHEQAAHISPRGNAPLEAGMVISNEPGYYRENAFGIRTESLVAVRRDERYDASLSFETLTLVPIRTDCLMAELMTARQIAWLNAYHARVRETLAPCLAQEPDLLAWLEAACQPVVNL